MPDHWPIKLKRDHINVRPKLAHGGFSQQLLKIGLPKLSPDEQQRLVERIINAKSPKIKDRLAWEFVLHSTGLVGYAITRYFPRYVSDEIFLEGLYGLYVAATRFKRFKGHQSYCISYIFGYIQKGIAYKFTQLSPTYRPDEKYHRTEIPVFGAFQFGHYYPEEFELVRDKIQSEMVTDDEVLRQILKEEREDNIKEVLEDFFKYLMEEKHWKTRSINALKSFFYKSVKAKRQAAKKSGTTVQNVYYLRQKARILFKRYVNHRPELRQQIESILMEEVA